MRSMLYLVGEPASGKSTVFGDLTRHCTPEPYDKPVAHICWRCGPHVIYEIGARRPTFSGTDALSMSGIVEAERWLMLRQPALVIAEGDRLACDRWFEFARSLEYRLWVFELRTSELKLSDRRLERDLLGAKPQNKSWIAGRKTKIANLLEHNEHYVLDGDLNPDRIVENMLSIATPFAVLREKAHA